MAGASKMAGSPWHIEYLTNDKDHYNGHRAKCIYKHGSYCQCARSKYYQRFCGGYSECSHYKKSTPKAQAVSEAGSPSCAYYKASFCMNMQSKYANNKCLGQSVCKYYVKSNRGQTEHSTQAQQISKANPAKKIKKNDESILFNVKQCNFIVVANKRENISSKCPCGGIIKASKVDILMRKGGKMISFPVEGWICPDCHRKFVITSNLLESAKKQQLYL